MSGRALYARVAPFADCAALAADAAPPYILRLCPDMPATERGSVRHYLRQTLFGTPDLPLPPGMDVNDARREFAVRVVANQPIATAMAVAEDFLRGFAWARTHEPGEYPLETWRFDAEVRPEKTDPHWAVLREFGGEPSVDPAWGAFLRDYQSIVYTRGPVFALGLILPVVAAARLAFARHPNGGLPALLVAATGAALLLSAAAVTFSWRYQLPSIPLLPWSAALALPTLWPRLVRAPDHHGGGHT